MMADSTHSPLHQAVVQGNGQAYVQQITMSHHTMVADEPVALGGTDTGPSPYDLLIAALGACTSITLTMYARRKNWKLEGVGVTLRHSKIHAADCEECDKREGMLDRIDREIKLEGDLSDEQQTRLLEIADKCPVHKTLVSEVSIKTRLI